jgi:alpha-amylase
MRTRLLPVLAAITLAPLAFGQATINPNAAAVSGRPAKERGIQPTPDAWWNQAVFYQIFIRSFNDSSSGPLANDGVGDLAGIIERLDYLNDGNPETTTDLGVTGLWLMPIMQSPSYHGYDTTDYKKVDDEYGTNEEYKRFLAECHKRGIRVILDLVLNHSSSEHPWFLESTNPDSPKRDWYIWTQTDPAWKGPWNQPVWHVNSTLGPDGGFYYGLFWKGMPDINYRNKDVTAAAFDVIRFWLKDMNTDGFRLDAIRHLIEDGKAQENTNATHEWLRGFFKEYKSIRPDALTVGEVWSGSDVVSTYVGDEMDIAFEFDLAGAITAAANDAKSEPFNAAWKRIEALYPAGMYATFLANHDQNRIMSQLGGDVSKAKLAAALQLCLPGVPFIYYGEEIGMVGVKPDEKIRTPMQWSAKTAAGFSSARAWQEPNADYTTKNVELQSKDSDSLLSLYRRLIHIRNATPALRTGGLTVVATGDPSVLAFERSHASGSVLVLANLAPKPNSSYTLAALSGRPTSELLGNTPLAAAAPSRPVASLAPRTVYILPLK